MKKIPSALIPLLIAAFSWAGLSASAFAEEKDQAALARALQPAKATLEAGLKTSEREGKPISAKFEIEGGKLFTPSKATTLPKRYSTRAPVRSSRRRRSPTPMI